MLILSFCRKILFHLFVGVFCLLALTASIQFVIHKKTRFQIGKTVDTIIIGHSIPGCAYNDSLISAFSNVSKAGQAYFYNHTMLKSVLQENSTIQNVLIEFSNGQIALRMNNWIWDEKYLINTLPQQASFLESDQRSVLLANAGLKLVSVLPEVIVKSFKIVIESKYNYIDTIGFVALNRNLIQENKPVNLKDMPSSSDSLKRISEVNLIYLRKMINLANIQGKKVYLVRTPVHHQNRVKMNESLFQQIKADQFSDVDFIDLSHLVISDSLFADHSHLNSKGANRYSVWFNRLLKEGLLTSSSRESFIKDRNHLF